MFINSIEVDHGDSIPTYPLIKQLEQQYPSNDFYFIIGSDLLPGLAQWDDGDKFIDEIGFVLFERKGHEEKMDPDGEIKFTMPKKIEIIDKSRTQVGQISSTEIRQRITEAKKKLQDAMTTKGLQNDPSQQLSSSLYDVFKTQTSMVCSKESQEDGQPEANNISYPSYLFYDIAGLCTKGTIDYI